MPVPATICCMRTLCDCGVELLFRPARGSLERRRYIPTDLHCVFERSHVQALGLGVSAILPLSSQLLEEP